MQSPIRVADETFVIPMPFEIPGFGILYINSMVIRGQEPILVETSAPIVRDDYLQAAFSLVDPKDVRWIFLSMMTATTPATSCRFWRRARMPGSSRTSSGSAG